MECWKVKEKNTKDSCAELYMEVLVSSVEFSL